MATKYKVEQLCGGPRWERLTPQSFDRGSAALAWLIEWARGRRSGAVIMSDPDLDNPGCFDVIIDWGGAMEQFAINIDR